MNVNVFYFHINGFCKFILSLPTNKHSRSHSNTNYMLDKQHKNVTRFNVFRGEIKPARHFSVNINKARKGCTKQLVKYFNYIAFYLKITVNLCAKTRLYSQTRSLLSFNYFGYLPLISGLFTFDQYRTVKLLLTRYTIIGYYFWSIAFEMQHQYEFHQACSCSGCLQQPSPLQRSFIFHYILLLSFPLTCQRLQFSTFSFFFIFLSLVLNLRILLSQFFELCYLLY